MSEQTAGRHSPAEDIRRWYYRALAEAPMLAQRLAPRLRGSALTTAVSLPSAREALSVKGRTTAYDYLFTVDPAFAHAIRRFEKRIPTGLMNPYEEPYPDRAYEVPTATRAELDLIFFSGEHEYLERSFALLGNKGSGKTAAQNCWLHERNGQLEKARIFWVRCDAAKLFDLWHETPEVLRSDGEEPARPMRLPGLDEYLDLQLVYVLAKYCMSDERAFIRGIFDSLAEVTFEGPVSRNLDVSATETRRVVDFLREVRTSIVHFEKNRRDSYMLDRLLYDRAHTQAREFRRWQACSTAIQRSMRDSGYRLLKIADGVDNVHINDEHSKTLYRRMMPMLARFLLSWPAPNEVRLVALRERTYYDMLKHKPTLGGTGDAQKPHRIWHRAPDRSEVVRRRLQWLREVEGFQASEGSFHALTTAALSITSHHIDDIFHGNIRSWLFNVASLVAQVRFRQMQGVENLANQIAAQQNRNLFLNGRFLLDTAQEWHELNHEQGVAVFNLFWCERRRGQPATMEGSQVLLRARLLELLASHEDGLSLDVITGTLGAVFGYPGSLVAEAVDHARAFGWIDCSLADGLAGGEDVILLALNPGGRFLLHTLLSQVDTLYYFGLDTRLPRLFVDKGLLAWHVNDRFERTGFRSAALSTALCFVLYACTVNHRETAGNAAYDEAVQSGVYQPFLFTPRHLRCVARSARRMLAALEPDDLSRLMNLRATFQQLLDKGENGA